MHTRMKTRHFAIDRWIAKRQAVLISRATGTEKTFAAWAPTGQISLRPRKTGTAPRPRSSHVRCWPAVKTHSTQPSARSRCWTRPFPSI